MSDTLVKVDRSRTAALQAAVSAGGAASVQDAVECAVDAWLAEQALANLPQEALQRLWQEGVRSGDAGTLDLDAVKAEARRLAGVP
jgi:Arc/MetJ-type ribon-helix-helix transcriptional regulator